MAIRIATQKYAYDLGGKKPSSGYEEKRCLTVSRASDFNCKTSYNVVNRLCSVNALTKKIIPVTINIKSMGYSDDGEALRFEVTTSVRLLDNIILLLPPNGAYFDLYNNRDAYSTHTAHVSTSYWVDTCKLNVETLKNAFKIQNQSTWEEKYEFTFAMTGTWPTEAPSKPVEPEKPSSDPSKVDYDVGFNPTSSSVGNMPVATVWNRDTTSHTVMVRVKVRIADTSEYKYGNSSERNVSAGESITLRVESIMNVDSRSQMVGHALYVDDKFTKRWGDIDV